MSHLEFRSYQFKLNVLKHYDLYDEKKKLLVIIVLSFIRANNVVSHTKHLIMEAALF